MLLAVFFDSTATRMPLKSSNARSDCRCSATKGRMFRRVPPRRGSCSCQAFWQDPVRPVPRCDPVHVGNVIAHGPVGRFQMAFATRTTSDEDTSDSRSC